MRRVSAVVIVLLLALWASMALAQSNRATPAPYIYRLKIGNCTFAPADRRQTGFRVQGMVGIVTALHGVADCKTVSAVADDGVIFTDLIIAAVDIDHDMALLTSPDLADLPTDGLAVSTLAPTEILTASLRIVGYPLGLDKQDVDLIESARDIEPLDGVIPDEEESAAFLKRKSPDIDIEVLNLQAQLLPGHSGAPVLDDVNGIVAIGDGGLRGGTVGRSWAIPWQAIKLASVDVPEVNKKLAELATKDISALSFSSTYPDSLNNTESATYIVRVVDADQMPIANAEVLLTHSAGYQIGMTDSEGFYIFHLPTNVSYVHSQIQVEAPGYPLYNRTLQNVLDKIGVEIVRLAPQRPAATMQPTNTPTVVSSSLCSFAFLVLDEQSEEPIRRATVTVLVGIRQDTGTTDSTGYYLAHLPCSNEQDVEARVRVSDDDYSPYNRSVFLSNETTEVLLERKATFTPTATIVPKLDPSLTPIPTVTVSLVESLFEDDLIGTWNTQWVIDGKTEPLIVRIVNIAFGEEAGSLGYVYASRSQCRIDISYVGYDGEYYLFNGASGLGIAIQDRRINPCNNASQISYKIGMENAEIVLKQYEGSREFSKTRLVKASSISDNDEPFEPSLLRGEWETHWFTKGREELLVIVIDNVEPAKQSGTMGYLYEHQNGFQCRIDISYAGSGRNSHIFFGRSGNVGSVRGQNISLCGNASNIWYKILQDKDGNFVLSQLENSGGEFSSTIMKRSK
jgi:hypothetical protein